MPITSPGKSHTEFAAAFNAGDLDALCDMYEPDSVFVPEPGAAAIRGTAAIRDALANYLAMKPKMEIETVYAHENGDLALLRANWKLTATGPDGQPVEMNGSSSEVLRRQADGTWRQIIDHPFGAG
jgi:uncharacterized protein (TIGR02246 family)